MIVNSTDSSVTITYTVKESVDLAKVDQFSRLEWPPLLLLSSAEDGSVVEAPIRSDQRNGQIEVELPSGQGLVLATLPSYSRPDLKSWDDFPIQRIRITSEAGALEYCGPGLLLAFDGHRDQQSLVFTGTPRQLNSGFCEGGR